MIPKVNQLNQDLSLSIATFDFDELVPEILADPSSFGITNRLVPACRNCGSGNWRGARGFENSLAACSV